MRKYGAEVIKICATGGVLSQDATRPGAQQMSLDEMKAVADEAHMLGMKVAAHAHGTAGINDAIRAGVDTIEHASLADAESFQLAKAAGAWFSMDIYNDDYILAEGAKNGVHRRESLEKEREIGRKQRETFRDAHAAGVKMVFGTDNGGVFPARHNALQFAKMVEWGMTPMRGDPQPRRSTPREALGRPGDVGAIAVGPLRRHRRGRRRSAEGRAPARAARRGDQGRRAGPLGAAKSLASVLRIRTPSAEFA